MNKHTKEERKIVFNALVRALIEAMNAYAIEFDRIVDEIKQEAKCGDCPHHAICCTQAVGMSAWEALSIAKFVSEKRPDLIPRIEESSAELRALGYTLEKGSDIPGVCEDWYNEHKFCPMFEDGKCAIYEIRPIACRGTFDFKGKNCDFGTAAIDTPDENYKRFTVVTFLSANVKEDDQIGRRVGEMNFMILSALDAMRDETIGIRPDLVGSMVSAFSERQKEILNAMGKIST